MESFLNRYYNVNPSLKSPVGTKARIVKTNATASFWRRYRIAAYSAFACLRIGMLGSASFQMVRKFLYSARAFTLSPDTASARARPRCASALRGQLTRMLP